MLRVRGSFWQFVREHISDPFWGIYNELVHNQPLTLTDANALADSSFRCRVRASHSLVQQYCCTTMVSICILRHCCGTVNNFLYSIITNESALRNHEYPSLD